jgi:hypothetical protein
VLAPNFQAGKDVLAGFELLEKVKSSLSGSDPELFSWATARTMRWFKPDILTGLAASEPIQMTPGASPLFGVMASDVRS